MVYRLVNSTYDVKELALRLTRLLCQFIQADSSSIYILEPKKNRVILIANFDNKINTLVTQKGKIEKIPETEKRVVEGYIVFEKHLIGLPMVADENNSLLRIQDMNTRWTGINKLAQQPRQTQG